MDRAAEGGVDDNAPVAQLVAESFDDDHPVGRQLGDRLALLGEVTQQVVGGPLVQAGGADPLPGCGRGQPADFAHERTDCGPELHWPPEGVALPERQPARLTRRRSH